MDKPLGFLFGKTTTIARVVDEPPPVEIDPLYRERASDRIVSRRLLRLGDAISNTTAFRCFQIHQAVSMTSEDVPLHNAQRADDEACSHRSTKSPSPSDGVIVDRIQD